MFHQLEIGGPIRMLPGEFITPLATVESGMRGCGIEVDGSISIICDYQGIKITLSPAEARQFRDAMAEAGL